MCGIRMTVSPIYSKILSKFPPKLSFCFAYGSGVKKQLQNAKPSMIDMIYCVENSVKWHEENMKMNSHHYSFLKYFGHNFIATFQENSGAKVYYNTLVNMDDVVIKYGVISRQDLVTDLLEWSDLYIAGRLHKPVEILRKTKNAELQTALQLNLRSAVHAALLLLPESFTEYDFYHTISNLSYGGDFRMTFGENKNKVTNIVKPQIAGFRNLYIPVIQHLQDYVDFPMITHEEEHPKSKESDSSTTDASKTEQVSTKSLDPEPTVYCKQDINPLAKLHHLNQLPRWPQKAITRFWNRGSVGQDTEDVLRAIAYDLDCGAIVDQCIKDIVWRSSVRQSMKGILTAGVVKSVKYSSKKIYKMIH